MIRLLRPGDFPLKFKLIAVTLCVAVLISTVSIVGFRMAVRQSNEIIYTQTANSLGFLSDKIAARLGHVMDISFMIATNRSMQDSLKTLNSDGAEIARSLARTAINEFLFTYTHADIINISVIPKGDSPINWGIDSSSENPDVLSYALLTADAAGGAPVWHSAGRQDGSLLCVREIRSVATPFLDHIGYLVVRVNLGRIVRESARGVLSITDYTINIYQDTNLLYPIPGREEMVLPRGNAAQKKSYYAIEAVDGEMQFLVYSPISAFRVNWYLALGIPYGAVFRAQIAANASFFASVAVAVIAASILSIFMFGGINRHLSLLWRKMDRIRAGNLEPLDDPLRLAGDELGILNRYFDDMRADFKQVIEDNYIKELLLTQTQLKALEQQINPHFLYNSLEAVHWFARRGDSESIAVIIGSLGSLLRNALSEHEDTIPLKKELDILDSYLRIQRIRFPDTLHIDIKADENTYPIHIPKMSIQPLVENAIIHSLEENVGGCAITVRATLSEGKIKIEVENDGSEIHEDILNLLRDKQVKAKGSGVGLINIDTRIKLLFGQEYGLRFKSGGDRVAVSYELPADRGEDSLAENSNRRR